MVVERASSTGRTHAVPGNALHVSLDGSGFLSFPLLGRLFVEFAPAQLGQNAGFLAGTLETAQGGIEIFILANTDAGHRNPNLLIWLKFYCGLRRIRAAILMSRVAKGKSVLQVSVLYHARSGD
jgi:hypothetical protein